MDFVCDILGGSQFVVGIGNEETPLLIWGGTVEKVGKVARVKNVDSVSSSSS